MKTLIFLALTFCLSVKDVFGRSLEDSNYEGNGLKTIEDIVCYMGLLTYGNVCAIIQAIMSWDKLARIGLKRCTPFSCCPMASRCCGDYGTYCCYSQERRAKQEAC